jgi:hypothetical protein
MKSISKRSTLRFLGLALILLPFVPLVAQIPGHPVNRDALLAFVAGHVRVLEFNTDKPVRQLRALIDGKEAASAGWNPGSNNLKLAVVTAPDGRDEVHVYAELQHEGWFMKGTIRPLVEANLSQIEYFGPGKNLVLNDWTKVYGLSMTVLGDRAHALYDLRIEVK